jgi:hypothetical protein
MALRVASFPVFAVSAIFTPQGERHPACVVEVPETSVMEPTDVGIVLHHNDGTMQHYETPAHCHFDGVAKKMAARRADEQPNQWIDTAGYTYNSGFSKMTGYNNIPDAPQSNPQTDYWFLGMENKRGGPVNILQPVLTYKSSRWTAASWACCPSNISTTGPTIGPFKEGDRMWGSMIRKNSQTWEIVTQINGKTSTLNAQVGPFTYNWAVATFEDYGVSQCSQLPKKAVTFDTIMLYDESGSVVHPRWSLSGGTMCNGRTTSPNENTVSIQHGSGPSPTPTPHPTPSPTPSGQCHAISPLATDDWCNANCHAGNCPADLCKCDDVMV